MPPNGHHEELRIVEAVLALPVEERASSIERACRSNPTLRARVQDLLDRLDQGSSHELFERLLPALRSVTAVADDAAGGLGPDELRPLGKYRVERELGRGGQGIVYLAVDEALGRRVALKVLHPFAALEESTRLRFLREAGIASRLDHPGICVVYETGRERGLDYIAMRFVEGQTLARRIIEQPAPDLRGLVPGHDHEDPVRAVAGLVEKLARALHLMHEAGVLHRDVKSGNVIVTPEGEPVILDFGLAREQAPGATITLSEQILGTPSFMSPEQVAGPVRALDRRTDVWALGVVLYQCLTLALPFEAVTVHEVLRRIREEEPASPSRLNRRVPRDLEVIVHTALEKDLARRYCSALALAEDLRRFRRGEPILARPVGPLARALRYGRRHPMQATAGLLGCGVVGLLIGTAVLGSSLDEKARELMRHDDVRTSRELVEDEATLLWPVRERGEALFDDWLARFSSLQERRFDHAEVLEGLRARRFPDGRWADAYDSIFGPLLEEHVATLGQLDVLAPGVRERRERSLSLRARTVDEHAADWARCIAEIAASPDYDGLRIEPQVGLVPLGANQQGLFEFWHVESGELPERGVAGGVVIGENTGMVLVLLPGGTFAMGASATAGPNLDPGAQRSERPVKVALEPFLIAKHEMTQGQWLRLFGSNPSTWAPGRPPEGGIAIDLRHPVESVDWHEGVEALRRLDLLLPTEAQWEYACRAGTSTIWSTGDDLARAGSLANFRGEEANGRFGEARSSGYLDPFPRHAPVGSFPANGFGLQDMHGNVFEWTRDRYVTQAETLVARPGDALREPRDETGRRGLRGGSCAMEPTIGRSAARFAAAVDAKGYDIGLRAARTLSTTRSP